MPSPANGHMFRIKYFERNRWSQIIQRPSSHAHRHGQRQQDRVPQVGTSYFQNTHDTCLFIQFFQEKSIVNGLRYVRGLLVMLIDAENVIKAESHKWVCHTFKNTHFTFFISQIRQRPQSHVTCVFFNI